MLNEFSKPDPKLSNFAKAYRIAQRRFDKADIKFTRVANKEGHPPKNPSKMEKARNFVYKHAHKYGNRLDNLGANSNNDQRGMLWNQSRKNYNAKSSRRERMLAKYTDPKSPKKHKGLYMEWSERLGTILLDGFNMLNEFSSPDPKLSNFAKAYRLLSRRGDKYYIKAIRAAKNAKSSEGVYRAKAFYDRVANKTADKAENLANSEDFGDKILSNHLKKGTSRSRTIKMLNKYTDPKSPKKHKGLYMEWTERLANLIVEGLDPDTKKYRYYKTAARKMSKREKELRNASIMDRRDNKERALAGAAKTKNNSIAKQFLEKMKEKGLLTRDRSKK